MEFVPCAVWIKRGVAKPIPTKVQLTKEELKEIVQSSQQELGDQENLETRNDLEDENEDQEIEPVPDNPDDEYNMESYDAEDDRSANVLRLGNLAIYDDTNGDPYVNIPDQNDDSESEIDDETIRPDDNLIVVGDSKEDVDVLKIYLYNEANNDLYVHHDILLSSCPLALEPVHLPAGPSEGSNFVAVGLMTPVIEIWDLDVINTLEPVATLGYKAKKPKYAHRNIGHKKAVMSLCWNKNFDHVLASGSADKRILLWDLDKRLPSTTIKGFQGNIESLEWHPREGQTLLSGCSDSTVRIYDCRFDNSFKEWKVSGEASMAKWNPWNPFMIVVGTSEGKICGFDARVDSRHIWEVSPHSDSITCLSLVPPINGLMISGCVDGTINFWDASQSTPELLFTKQVDLDQLHTLSVNPDAPYIACLGGAKKSNKFKLLNMKSIEQLTSRWTMLNPNPNPDHVIEEPSE